MSERPDHEYVVMTEADRAYWVCVRRSAKPGWLQVVAGFIDKDRAEQYADVENEMLRDDPEHPRRDTEEVVPSTVLPPSRLPKLNGYHIPVIGTVPQPPRPQITDKTEAEPVTLPSLADEIIAALPLFMKTYDGGPTIKQVAMHLGAAEVDVRAAFKQIERHERAVIWRATPSGPYQLAPLGFEPPKLMTDLTENQAAVLRVFRARRRPRDGEVQTTIRELSEASGVPMGSVSPAIVALEKRNLVKAVVRSRGVYRVLEEGAQP